MSASHTVSPTHVAGGTQKPFVDGEGLSTTFVCLALIVSALFFVYARRQSAHAAAAPRHTSAIALSREEEALSRTENTLPPTVVHMMTPVDSEAPISVSAKAAQTNFFVVLGACYLADWMKGPYTIALFHSYGLNLFEIATLFIVGYMSSLVFGTIAGAVADGLGRARMCRYFCLFFAVSMATKVSSNFWILALGRVVGGVADSLLATVFEAWFVSQFDSQGPAFIRDTFVTVASYRSFAAVAAGAAAQLLATLFGNVAPFLAAIPLVGLALVQMRGWEENYGTNRKKGPFDLLASSAMHISKHRRLQLLCGCEALFEACMYIWVFNWSSALDQTNRQTPFGLVFAVFMISMMSGGVLGRRRTVGYWLPIVHAVAIGAAVLAALVFRCKELLFVAFALTELSVGLYYSTHPTLRAELVGNSTRSATMNLFRVPMNLIVFVVLLLHLTPWQNLCALIILQLGSFTCLYALRRMQ